MALLTIEQFQKDLQGEIFRRHKLYTALEGNKAAQEMIMTECRGDIMRFVNNFVWMDKNDTLITDPAFAEIDIIPMIPFDYQVDFIEDMWECIKMGIAPIYMRDKPTKMFMEKSRQM